MGQLMWWRVVPTNPEETMHTLKLDTDTQTLVTRGREAWATLRQDETWEKWLAIGRALDAGRSAVMHQLGTNQPKGRKWSEVFGPWLHENEFDQIDKGVRSRLQTCLDNLPAIEAWRQTLGLTLRLQLNHPNAVLRRWQASKEKDDLRTADPEKAISEPRRRPGNAAQIDDATQRLHETIDRVETRLGPDVAGLFDLSPEHVRESARNFVDIYGADGTRLFIAELQALLTPTPEPDKPVDPAFAESLAKPARERRGVKALDDPTRPRNRVTKFRSGAGLNVEMHWPQEKTGG